MSQENIFLMILLSSLAFTLGYFKGSKKYNGGNYD